MDILNYRKAKFGATELTIDDSLELPEWKELGAFLKQVEGSVPFWIGDWMRYGERKGYVASAQYDEAVEITGLARKTIQNYTSTAKAVDASGRREDLSFSHHAEVACLPEDQQDEVLTRASEEKATVREVRTWVQEKKETSKEAKARRLADKENWARIDAERKKEKEDLHNKIMSSKTGEILRSLSEHIATLPLEEQEKISEYISGQYYYTDVDTWAGKLHNEIQKRMWEYEDDPIDQLIEMGAEEITN